MHLRCRYRLRSFEVPPHMVSPAGSYSPLSLATRLVQAVDAPDPTGAALSAVSETLGSGTTAFYAFNPADSTIFMTHATLADALSRDAIALHHLDDESIAARTLREQAPMILRDYTPPDEAARGARRDGHRPCPSTLVSLPITADGLRFGAVQAINVSPRYVGTDAAEALDGDRRALRRGARQRPAAQRTDDPRRDDRTSQCIAGSEDDARRDPAGADGPRAVRLVRDLSRWPRAGRARADGDAH